MNSHEKNKEQDLRNRRAELENCLDIGIWVVTRKEDGAVFCIIADTQCKAIECIPDRWKDECRIQRVNGQLPINWER